MTCDNGYIINSTCLCDYGYTNIDDFYDGADCNVNLAIREILIIILLSIAIMNVFLSLIKIYCLYDAEMKGEIYHVNLLIIAHYMFVIINCCLLFDRKMNSALETIMTCWIAVLMGFCSILLKMAKILKIYIKVTLDNISDILSSSSKYMLLLTFICSLIWLSALLLMHFDEKKYVYLCLLFGSLSLITCIWSFGFYYYGNQILAEMRNAELSLAILGNQKINDDTEKIIKRVMCLYSSICLVISVSAILLIVIKVIYTRTIYTYTILGTVLGLIDFSYLMMTKWHQDQSNQIPIISISIKSSSSRFQETPRQAHQRA